MNDNILAMKLTTTDRREVEEASWGLYVWECEDGEWLGDDDGNMMNIACRRDDRQALAALAEAAAYYGYPKGTAVWLSGRRRITDEEYAEQVMREKLGLIPDPLDIGVIKDDIRNHNGR